MKVVEINAVPYGSTGSIAYSIKKKCEEKNIEVYFAFSWTKHKRKTDSSGDILIGSFWDRLLHYLYCRITGIDGKKSYFVTKKFIKTLKKINPDIIHLHNIHGQFINYKLLFEYIRNSKVRVIWTLHDCWAFTGYCPHFETVNCYKWKNACSKCILLKEKKYSLVDSSFYMYNMKKSLFTSLDDAIIVTPSIWLKKYVKESFLKCYDIKVINNGIDLNVFKPIKSNFRKINNINNKFIILGVAYGWTNKKGLNTFIKLSRDLGEDYKVVLVGTNEKIDSVLPNNILSIHRTTSKRELVEIYSTSDIFLNPTLEDTFPTVNIEALACGLPVFTYDTGGSKEIIDKKSGLVFKKKNYKELIEGIRNYHKYQSIESRNCVKRAESFDCNKKYEEYVKLYYKVLKNNEEDNNDK